MPLERASRQFGGDVSTVTEARHWLRHEFSGALPKAVELSQDAELVVSELVTNAVRARCSELRVTLVFSEHTVRVDVFDDAPGTPTLIAFEPDADHGRGLAIVAQLSQDWGVERAATGKHVWALLDTSAEEPFTAT